ncbi:hypothetical protein F0562_007664 [Nyssa sinensis]|uniref:Uncharacterized protein n=1 Tax=Nyssa sinensis TaxID=561372 RepID=A0A5J5A6A9_9ASTE|nr:hypothetical protein F0562_007664 [Nyssa sinensis]
MVDAVKKWQKSDPQKSLDTWRKLSEANSALETRFNTLSKLAAEHWEAYKGIINSCSMLSGRSKPMNRAKQILLKRCYAKDQVSHAPYG